jgi:hypothetical protein
VQSVLNHDRGDGGDVVDLAAHHPDRGRPGKITTAATAGHGHVIDNLVRIAGLQQRRPARAGLLAGRHRGPISRGWLRGVARVAAQLPFQLRDPRVLDRDPHGELRDHPGLLLDQREEFLAR